MTTETETYKRVLAFVCRMIGSEGLHFTEYHAERCLPGFEDEEVDEGLDEEYLAKYKKDAEKITRALISGEKW